MSALDDIKARVEGHTEGPWFAGTAGEPSGGHWYVAAQGQAVAHISPHDGENEDERRPNAELIAAAPKLLNALEAMAVLHAESLYGEHCRECADSYPCPTIRAVREALA